MHLLSHTKTEKNSLEVINILEGFLGRKTISRHTRPAMYRVSQEIVPRLIKY